MPKINGEAGQGVQSVILALRLLEHLAGAPEPVGVTELAKALGTTKTRVHRHLRTLTQQGYITQSPQTGRYRIGTRLVTLGRQVAEGTDLSIAAQPHLFGLRERLGQSCVLSQMEHEGARIIMALSGRSPIEIGVKPGSLLPFNYTAQGKVMLAFASEEFRRQVLSRPMSGATKMSVTDPAVLTRQLSRIRTQGWAVAPNESAVGLNALAAPIFDESGAVVGALALVDLVQFISAEPTPEQVEAISGTAAAVSTALGYSGVSPVG